MEGIFDVVDGGELADGGLPGRQESAGSIDRPTAFFAWCVSERFGVTSPEGALVSRSDKNVSSGEVGFAEHRAWTPCKTEAEAR